MNNPCPSCLVQLPPDNRPCPCGFVPNNATQPKPVDPDAWRCANVRFKKRCLMPVAGFSRDNRCAWHHWFPDPAHPATRVDFDHMYPRFESYGWTVERKEEIWVKVNGGEAEGELFKS